MSHPARIEIYENFSFVSVNLITGVELTDEIRLIYVNLRNTT